MEASEAELSERRRLSREMSLEKRPEAGYEGAWSGLLRSAFICKAQGPLGGWLTASHGDFGFFCSCWRSST